MLPYFKPPLSHIIIDIRTKKTLDSLEAKNRTNIIIARRPAKVKTLDSLEAKNRTNIARRPAKVKTLDSLDTKNRTNIIARRPIKAKLFKLKLDKSFIETCYDLSHGQVSKTSKWCRFESLLVRSPQTRKRILKSYKLT